jgi:DNA-binding NtrC family response regulator
MAESRTILVVDDEPDLLRLLARSLAPDLNCRVETAASGKAAMAALGKERFDLVLADIKMPKMDGLELLELIKREWPDQTVVMMTGHGRIDTAVAAMKQGAHDFITKPFDHEALVIRLEKALERSALIRENLRLKASDRETEGLEGLVGKSPAMRRVFDTIRMVAGTDLTVLVTGESGTGKDLTARAVHALSVRGEKPFIAVNCPTVPEQILESELFGYRKGAFTHATQNRTGLFQEADGGSIFLDEIGDVPPAIQTKLLRVLQEKEIKPLGANQSVTVDVRIIASTNQDLRAKIQSGEFREDFFYRLNVLPIRLPPLRDRREDIPLIVNHLLHKHARKLDREGCRVPPDEMARIVEASWAGNVRELENVLVRGILFAENGEVRLGELRDRNGARAPDAALEIDPSKVPYKTAKEENLKRFNESYIGRLLERSGGNVTRAARACGLERQSLQQIMRRYGISADSYRE